VSMKKYSFGYSVICSVTGEEVTAVWAKTQADALAGRGISDEGLKVQEEQKKPEPKPRGRGRGKDKGVVDEQASKVQATSSAARADG